MNENIHKRGIKYSNDYPWEEKEDSLSEEIQVKDGQRSQSQSEQAKANGFAEVFYGRPLSWYKEIILWPMFILLLLELGIRVMQSKYLYLWNENIFSCTIYLVRIVLFGYLSIAALKRYQATIVQTVFAAGLGGLIIGFVLAVFQLFWYFEPWTFFNLFGQPLLMITIGVAVSALCSIIIKKVIK